MHGLGVFTWASGEQYKGEFSHGKLEGTGKKVYNSGDAYVGEWLNNAPHGHGEKTYACGDKFVGRWRHGKREGFGEYTFAERDEVIEACWVEDKLHGRAILRDGTMRTYLEYRHGLKHGHSVLIRGSTQGTSIFSEWVRDKKLTCSVNYS